MTDIPPEIERRLGRIEKKFDDGKIIYRDIHDRDIERLDGDIDSALRESTAATEAAAKLIMSKLDSLGSRVKNLEDGRKVLVGLMASFLVTLITGIILLLLQTRPG